ncbi:MAG: aldo/keto reductase [Bacteroidetes bacterium]|nr:MAG: aldo/keto reductase [Bacteroidota bacterium]
MVGKAICRKSHKQLTISHLQNKPIHHTMNKLILGTVQFGLNYGINNPKGKPEKETVFQILDYAYDQGIRLLDTADAYGNAAPLIGEFHRTTGKKFDVITKFTLGSGKSPDPRSALRLLDVDSIWGYLYHSFEDFVQYPEVLGELKKWQNKGFIQHIGLSVYTNEAFETAIETDAIQLIQLPFNLLDNERQRGDLIKKAKARNKIIHTRSTFLQGLFFKDADHLPPKLSPLRADIGRIQSLAHSHNMDVATLALRYVAANPLVDQLLIGVDNLDQLKTNLKALQETSLPPELVHQINSIAVQDAALLNPSTWS